MEEGSTAVHRQMEGLNNDIAWNSVVNKEQDSGDMETKNWVVNNQLRIEEQVKVDDDEKY